MPRQHSLASNSQLGALSDQTPRSAHTDVRMLADFLPTSARIFRKNYIDCGPVAAASTAGHAHGCQQSTIVVATMTAIHVCISRGLEFQGTVSCACRLVQETCEPGLTYTIVMHNYCFDFIRYKFTWCSSVAGLHC